MIDLEAADRALVEAQGSVRKAAKKLGVPTGDLRRLIARNPDLLEASLEAAERDLDKAEQIILDGLDSADKLKRLEAAALVLKARGMLRKR